MKYMEAKEIAFLEMTKDMCGAKPKLMVDDYEYALCQLRCKLLDQYNEQLQEMVQNLERVIKTLGGTVPV